MIFMTEIKRKGSRSNKDIPAEIMLQLNSGLIETANLVEWLAVDQRILLQHLLKELDRSQYLNSIFLDIDNLKKKTVNTINEAIGVGLFKNIDANQDTELFYKLANHTSDCVRCWSTYIIGFDKNLSISQKLIQIQPFAADSHFGVREIAWLSVRQSISDNLGESISILVKWTTNADENIRRFASEAIRPRGVWCAHIEVLKQNPELALSILEALKADVSKYVQNSVANWLNDASKSKPEFVILLCQKWKKESNSVATVYITNRALRTIEK
jgi:3-methyladenine DNA glycosylase AlkC